MEVYAPGGEPVPLAGGELRLEEARQYYVAPGGHGDATAFLGPMALEWDAAQQAFRLPVAQWAGRQLLRLLQGDTERSVPVTALPRAEKVSKQAWTTLLLDLEQWLPGLSSGEQPGQQGSVTTGGARLPHLVEAVLPLVPGFLAALRDVVAAPRQRTDRSTTFLPAHRVRRVERETLTWLERHPKAARALSARWDADAEHQRPPLVPVGLATATLDHAANRYVSWLVRTIARDFEAIAERLEKPSGGGQAPAGTEEPDWERWRTGRAESLRRASTELLAVWKRSWLASVTPAPPTETAIAVVMDDPAYARLHRLGRRFRSPLFQLATLTGAPAAWTRPTYELYELWTFIALRRLLEQLLPEHRWTSHGVEPLASLGEPLHDAWFEATGPQGTLRLLFNPTFRGYLARGTAPRFSISANRRPDLVMLWESGAQRRWVCLDAKYRVAKDALANAFESAHLYRDSLRWPEWGGRCDAAVLLAPAELPGCAPWFTQSFLAEHQVGAFRFTPGAEASPLTNWLQTLLDL